MLPGFRFLFAAIVLSMSILVFGLGAAALLRAAHEEFASTPSWRAAPETMFAQPAEPTRPVLAMLRVDPPVADKTPEKFRIMLRPMLHPCDHLCAGRARAHRRAKAGGCDAAAGERETGKSGRGNTSCGNNASGKSGAE